MTSFQAQLFYDGGAIYNLSASPGTLIMENHIQDVPQWIALYLDEGSRYIAVRNNVIEGAGVWLTAILRMTITRCAVVLEGV